MFQLLSCGAFRLGVAFNTVEGLAPSSNVTQSLDWIPSFWQLEVVGGNVDSSLLASDCCPFEA
jgi:hypothetical protein